MKLSLRRLPPVYSPLSASALWAGALQAVHLSPDSRRVLHQRLVEEFNADHVSLCGSGTQALQLSLLTASERRGASPTVALPAFTCYDVATAAVGFDARVALYDIDPGTLGPDFDSLRRVIQQGARIVVISPLYGIPVDWRAVEDLAANHSVVVIEDAAQGHGAAWDSKPLGSLGELSILSFGRGKGWTGVRGGALLTRNRSGEPPPVPPPPKRNGVEARVLLGGLAQWTLARPSLYNFPASLAFLGLGETTYRDPSRIEPLSRSAAAILERTWDNAAEEARRRRENAEVVLRGLSGSAVRAIQVSSRAAPGYLRLPLRLRDGMTGFDDPGDALRLGIAPAYPTTLAEIPQLEARLVQTEDRWPGADELVRTLVTVPSHSLAAEADRQEVLRLLNNYPA